MKFFDCKYFIYTFILLFVFLSNIFYKNKNIKKEDVSFFKLCHFYLTDRLMRRLIFLS
jgi:hypothetical protein